MTIPQPKRTLTWPERIVVAVAVAVLGSVVLVYYGVMRESYAIWERTQ